MKRLPLGGMIDRTRQLRFRWDGRELVGFHGDTLASALLAAGVSVVGRGLTLGRPRGVMSAGAEEAHGFAQVGDGTISEPLVRTTAVELFDGLVAESRSAKGRLEPEPEPARFDKRHAFCDLLVVGAGPAGLAAAGLGSLAGLRVILVEQEPELGGALLRQDGGMSSAELLERLAGRVESGPETTVLRATTALTMLDGNGMVLVQRVGGRLARPDRGALPEQRLWQIRARRIVLATGALERPIVFPDNDRPGVMLATAARTYLHRFALVPDRGVVFTTTDDGYRTALDWHEAGASVAGVVDPRPAPSGTLVRQVRAAGIAVYAGAVVHGTAADDLGRLAAVSVLGPTGTHSIDCDLLAVSGGFDPALNLHHQLKGGARWDDRLQCVVPVGRRQGQDVAGAAAGLFALGECLDDGVRAAAEALGVRADLGLGAVTSVEEEDPAALWRVPAPDGDESRSFVDLYRDVTVEQLARSADAGLRHIEHVKRYTLAGTGIDQGRAAKTNTGAIAAEVFGRPVAEIGASSARPPVEPMMFRALAGRAAGARYEPIRTTPLHSAHEVLGAVFEPVGQWLRPRYYPREGETMASAVARETRAARTGVGVVDVSTLGKIEVQGPDAAEFLERLYATRVANLAVGKARYGLLCGLDGAVFDDGVVMRLGEGHFFVTTSTSHAAAVLDWMEDWLQSEWPGLAVWVGSATEQWATVALVGPTSRLVMAQLLPEADWSPGSFPFMAVRRLRLTNGMTAQVARVSFSGELAYEVSVPASFGRSLWLAALAAGAEYGVTPYGTEALMMLRAEKGYLVVGQDTEAGTTPSDVGLGRMTAKADYVGKRAQSRSDSRREGRRQLVGFLTGDPTAVVPFGAVFVADPGESKPMTVIGHVTASYQSEALGRTFGLALVKGGAARHGEQTFVMATDRSWPVTLCSPVHYDPNGERRDG